MVSATNSHGHILCFLDWSHYYFFQVAPQLYSRGCVDPVPDPLLLRKSGSSKNQTRTSESVARNSDHWTTEGFCYALLPGHYRLFVSLVAPTKLLTDQMSHDPFATYDLIISCDIPSCTRPRILVTLGSPSLSLFSWPGVPIFLKTWDQIFNEIY
jgi:hypothetical protein